MKQSNSLAFSDRLLCGILGSIQHNAGWKPPPQDKRVLQSSSKDEMDQAGALPQEFQSGQDLYCYFQQMELLSEQNAEFCRQESDASAQQMYHAEDEKNRCYQNYDQFQEQMKAAQAQKEKLDEMTAELSQQIENLTLEIAALTKQVHSLEEDKKIYDVLRWIPVVNLVSELVAELTKTRDKLYSLQREQDSSRQELNSLEKQRQDWVTQLQQLEDQALQCRRQIESLEQQLSHWQKKQQQFAQEAVDWDERKQYYQKIANEIQRLIDEEADYSAYQTLLAENPPPFSPAA